MRGNWGTWRRHGKASNSYYECSERKKECGKERIRGGKCGLPRWLLHWGVFAFLCTICISRDILSNFPLLSTPRWMQHWLNNLIFVLLRESSTKIEIHLKVPISKGARRSCSMKKVGRKSRKTIPFKGDCRLVYIQGAITLHLFKSYIPSRTVINTE